MKALDDLNHEWTLEDEREFIQIYEDKTAEELAEHFNREPEEVIVMALHVKRQQRLLEEREKAEGIVYNKDGKMEYHPDYHDRQKEDWTFNECEYLCKYHDIDGVHSIGLALGRTPRQVHYQLKNLRTRGEYEFYRKWRKAE
jgi:hypothetical protein